MITIIQLLVRGGCTEGLYIYIGIIGSKVEASLFGGLGWRNSDPLTQACPHPTSGPCRQRYQNVLPDPILVICAKKPFKPETQTLNPQTPKPQAPNPETPETPSPQPIVRSTGRWAASSPFSDDLWAPGPEFAWLHTGRSLNSSEGLGFRV